MRHSEASKQAGGGTSTAFSGCGVTRRTVSTFAVLGFKATPSATVSKVGPLPIAGAPQTGWYFATATNPDGSRAWQFYAVKVWGWSASRVNFGWKLWSAPGLCQFAMTINPYLTV